MTMPDVPPEAVTARDTIAGLLCVKAGWAFGVPADGRETWLDAVVEAAELHIRAQVYAEIRQLSVERGAEYRTPPCTNQGCPEVVGEHVHRLPFADLIGKDETDE
jgi:hypothetical protein